jgi:hypothetical protein
MAGRKRNELTGTGIVTEFARRLRTLRDESGLTLRQLAIKSGYSHSVLSLAESGRVVSSWEVIAAFVRSCGQDPAQWRQIWEIAHVAAVADAQPAPREPASAGALADIPADAGQGGPARPVRRRVAAVVAAAGLAALLVATGIFLSAATSHNHDQPVALTPSRQIMPAKDGTDPYADGCKADEKELDWQPVMRANHATFGTIKLMYSAACQAAWGYLDGPNTSAWTTHIIAHRIPGSVTAPSQFSGNAAYGSWGNVLSTRAGCVSIEAYVVDGTGRGASAMTACIQPSLPTSP